MAAVRARRYAGTVKLARIALLVAAWLAVAPPAAAQAGGVHADPPFAGAALVAALRGGGYVLYLRHTSTDFSQNDARMTSYADFTLISSYLRRCSAKA